MRYDISLFYVYVYILNFHNIKLYKTHQNIHTAVLVCLYTNLSIIKGDLSDQGDTTLLSPA